MTTKVDLGDPRFQKILGHVVIRWRLASFFIGGVIGFAISKVF